MLYDYKCDQCEIIYEVSHSMFDEQDYFCPTCNAKLRKLFTAQFYTTTGLKPSLGDLKEKNYIQKVKDPERAIKSRVRAFGKDSVGDPKDQPDPKHLVKGRVLAGQQKEVDKQEFIKAAAKDDFIVKAASEAIKKSKK